jgi:LysW-gamma-L-lysine carboxypeptidase
MSAVHSDPVKLLVDSLKIYSPSTEEAPLADHLIGVMKDLGYSRVRTDSAGNIIGEVGRGKARLLLCGHMDTVPGKLPVKRTKEMVYGRGASDAKAPLLALLIAGSRSADSGVRITFAGATEEEGDGAGINRIIRSPQEYDYAVFGEPSGASKVTIGYRGRVSIHVAVKTSGGHAGSPWANRSAFDEFVAVMGRLKEYQGSREVLGDHFRSLSVSPTLVRAGSFHNVVPNLCEATLDLRVPPPMKASEAIAGVKAAAGTGSDGVTIEVRPGEATEPYQADTNSKLVRAFQRAIIIRLKEKPGLIRKTGTGDMNTFAERKRAQCVTYGPGMSKTSHTDHEAVQVADYLSSIEVLKEAVSQLGGTTSGLSD